MYVYTRTLEDERYLVLLSFSTKKVERLIAEIDFQKADLVISNDAIYPTGQVNTFELMLYQACIYKLH